MNSIIIQYIVVFIILLLIIVWICFKLFKSRKDDKPGNGCPGCALSNSCNKPKRIKDCNESNLGQ